MLSFILCFFFESSPRPLDLHFTISIFPLPEIAKLSLSQIYCPHIHMTHSLLIQGRLAQHALLPISSLLLSHTYLPPPLFA